MYSSKYSLHPLKHSQSHESTVFYHLLHLRIQMIFGLVHVHNFISVIISDHINTAARQVIVRSQVWPKAFIGKDEMPVAMVKQGRC